ncbi:carboxymuconolactone decarboxylase family protein [Desulfogranum marinum]|uniref:carboxymuconolactone decarboxylase family protein n=1 Tax=Desulfogranum marinum TaxID=453220 RepID=UPI001E64962C|nr:carboxymuconolactone decarboxylase family protein [Desulfogranum marinum]
METLTAKNNTRLALLKKLRKELPQIMELDAAKWDTTYQDGALSRKTKRLMALAIGLRAGCENCIIAQTMHAIDAGATRAEIMETISVNMAMSGTTGVGEGLKVIQLLDELGL